MTRPEISEAPSVSPRMMSRPLTCWVFVVVRHLSITQTIANDAIPMLDEESQEVPIEMAYEDLVGHPRIPGTKGKCLRLARENGIPLINVLNNASTMSARMLCRTGVQQMCVRGKIQPGMIADIVVFDPKTVRGNSDYTSGKNGLPTTGIPFVVVAGQVVVSESTVDLTVKAGQPIRFQTVTYR